jgi:hypothetical protein
VVSVEGDAISKAVKEHPQGLNPVTIVCATDRPCMRIDRSTEYGVK